MSFCMWFESLVLSVKGSMFTPKRTMLSMTTNKLFTSGYPLPYSLQKHIQANITSSKRQTEEHWTRKNYENMSRPWLTTGYCWQKKAHFLTEWLHFSVLVMCSSKLVVLNRWSDIISRCSQRFRKTPWSHLSSGHLPSQSWTCPIF